MTAVDELIAFVRAALDEDERVAQAAIDGCTGTWQTGRDEGTPRSVFDDHGCQVVSGRDRDWPTPPQTEHIARWDPARVLAKVKADRRILDLHAPQPTGYVDGMYVHGQPGELQCSYCASLCHSRSGMGCDDPDAPYPCPTVRLLAQPYAGQPGWREEWRS